MHLLKVSALSSLIFFSHIVGATVFNTTQHTGRGEGIWPIAISPVEVLGVAIAERQGEPTLYVQQYTRDSGPFEYRGVKNLISLPINGLKDSEGEYRIDGVQRDDDAISVLLSYCEEARCTSSLITLTINGQVTNERELPLQPCSEFTLRSAGIYSACGEWLSLNSNDVLALPTNPLDAVFYDEQFIALSVESSSNRLLLTVGATALPLSFSSENLACGFVDIRIKSNPYYRCIYEDEVGDQSTKKYRSQQGRLDLDNLVLTDVIDRPWDPTQSLDTKITRLTLSKAGEHFFSLLASGGSAFIENSSVTGDVFSLRVIRQEVSGPDSQWSLEPDAFYHVISGRSSNGGDLLHFFDFIQSDSTPRLVTGFPLSAFSTLDYSHVLSAVDEETLDRDMVWDWEDLPFFFTWNNEERTLSAITTHEDVGDYSFSLTLQGSKGSQRYPFDFSLLLTPYTLEIFEATLFSRLNVDGPLPLDSLNDAVPVWQILEDDVFLAQFSAQYRETDDLIFTVDENTLPNWLAFNEEKKTFSGTPLQRHVGEHVVSFTVTDRFDENSVISHTITLDVIEVNDPFSIVSDGAMTINVDELYQYQLLINDEETAIDSFIIQAALIPSWLTWDPLLQTLSGKVPASASGRIHTVQFVIQEPGGISMLHQFSITVNGESVKEESGGSFSWLTLIALLVCIRVRRRKHNVSLH